MLGLRSAEKIEGKMNELASDGWEFVGATTSREQLAIVIMEQHGQRGLSGEAQEH